MTIALTLARARGLRVTLTSLALLAASPGLAVADIAILRSVYVGTPCTSLDVVGCWAATLTGVPLGRLPNAGDWVMIGGDDASQPAGRTHTFGTIQVIGVANTFVPDFTFPSTFTQNGTMNLETLSVEDGRYTVAGGTGTFKFLGVGDPISGAPRGRQREPVFEQRGGTVNAQSEVKVGSANTSSFNGISSGEIRLSGSASTFNAPKGLKGAGVDVTIVTSTLVLDGGLLATPSITDFTDIVVGSGATPFGFLDVGPGQTVSTRRISIGVGGAEGYLFVGGKDALLTAKEMVIGTGADSRGYARVGVGDSGKITTGSLTLGVERGSYGFLQVEGPRTGTTAVLELTGALDVGVGGKGEVRIFSRGQVGAGSARIGAGDADSPESSISISGAGSSFVVGSLTVGAGSGGVLDVKSGGSLQADSLTAGDGGVVKLDRAVVDVGEARFDAGSTLQILLRGATAGTDYTQLLELSEFHFNGTLALEFIAGFVPTLGQRFQLFGFDTFSGSFGPDAITVAGFDEDQIDFRRLGVDGSFVIGRPTVPVPEPATWLASGLGLVGLAAIRKVRKTSLAA